MNELRSRSLISQTNSARVSLPTGVLKEWVRDKGYGFIHPRGGGLFVFVHIRELDLDPSQLVIGDLLQYEIGTGRDGRARAVRVRWAD
jgi:CspA family cold shock protein